MEEIELPKLTVKTEEFRAGGMDAPVELDMGMEKLESTLTLSGVDRELLKLWGVAPGNLTPLTVRGSLQSEDGTVTSVEVRLRGHVKEIDWGTWKPGEKARSRSCSHSGTTSWSMAATSSMKSTWKT